MTIEIKNKSDVLGEVLEIYSHVLNRVLLFAESSMPEKNYLAFRKLVIHEFGHGGAKDKVTAVIKKN